MIKTPNQTTPTFSIELTLFKNSSSSDTACANYFINDKETQGSFNQDTSNEVKIESNNKDINFLLNHSKSNKTTDYFTFTTNNIEHGIMTTGSLEPIKLSYNLNITNATLEDLSNTINRYTNNIITNDIDFAGGRFNITSGMNIDKNFYTELNKDKAYILGDYSHETKYGKFLPEDIFGIDKIQYISFIPPVEKRIFHFADRKFKKYNFKNFSVFPNDEIFLKAPIFKSTLLPSGYTFLQLTENLNVMSRDEIYLKTWTSLYRYLFQSMQIEYQNAFKKGGIDSLHYQITNTFFSNLKKKDD